MWDGDRYVSNIRESGENEMLMAGIDVDFLTCWRTKFAGKITRQQEDGDGYEFAAQVRAIEYLSISTCKDQSLSFCSSNSPGSENTLQGEEASLHTDDEEPFGK